MYHWDQLSQMGAITREQQAVTRPGAFTPIDAPQGTVVVPYTSPRRKRPDAAPRPGSQGSPLGVLLVYGAVAYGVWQVFGKKLFGKRKRR